MGSSTDAGAGAAAGVWQHWTKEWLLPPWWMPWPRAGASVDLLGHSFGGFCAFGAATLTSNIRKGWAAPNPAVLAIPSALQERMDALLAEGERERVLEAFFREVVRMPVHEFERYRTLPAWQARIAAAHTITVRTEDTRANLRSRGGEEDRGAGAAHSRRRQSAGDAGRLRDRRPALPDARITVMDGQQHIAIDLIPEELGRRVPTFLH